MTWCPVELQQLKAGHSVYLVPYGRSMEPLIFSGDKVRLEPVFYHTVLRTGDIVLCHVGTNLYLHKIVSITKAGAYKIGNNKGKINGFTTKDCIYGRVIHEGE